jgi:hypothetical protein
MSVDVVSLWVVDLIAFAELRQKTTEEPSYFQYCPLKPKCDNNNPISRLDLIHRVDNLEFTPCSLSMGTVPAILPIPIPIDGVIAFAQGPSKAGRLSYFYVILTTSYLCYL